MVSEKKTKFDPRKMMELAVSVMENTIHEPRIDGKKSPLVGAVLVKPNGEKNTACRGELREGDHAEYTLIERKNRSEKLDGSVLFATLEPCAPGARNHPKLSCAERIVNARIKEVWIGIEDPDPTVNHKGMKYLQNHGVTVKMFDRDLQEKILEINNDFILQAEERAKEKQVNEDIDSSISKLDLPLSVPLSKLSKSALEIYKKAIGFKSDVESPAFYKELVEMGILEEKEDGAFNPTGFGLLLFGEDPRKTYSQAGLLGTIHYPSGKEGTEDFNDPLVLIPGKVEEWMKNKLPNVIDRSSMERQQQNFPFELIREAVVNALVHRDYDIDGAKCHLIITPNTIVIKSPGGPVAPITLDQLKEFKAPMLSRNPKLHYVFSQMALAEERGLGMKSFETMPAEYNLPSPQYSYDDLYLTLTIYLNSEEIIRGYAPELVNELSAEELKRWDFIAKKRIVTSNDCTKAFNITSRATQRQLNRFIEIGLLEKIGKGPATRYKVK
ncbi:ATP-binding protein [Methanolobus bombayensis]|uniref:ATP-binding protein n=1 Tax=Methanolobus bombayensis TaxID=38023 RepID=UPI001AE14323|nr:ATP-binding protein [Methanolobus bombayensis]MBP1910333.1 ATP-dependent DNA helicase RecG [Methanolobus bombayensis]